MVKNFFRSPPPLGDAIFQSIQKLKVQYVRLEQVTIRLRERNKGLFEKCVIAIKSKNRDRAVICANELAEVRKLYNFIVQTQLALERVILRLETIRELSDVMTDLLPALRALKNVTGQLSKVMPEMSLELEKVSDSINETLAMASIRPLEPVVPLEIKTPAGEEILNEVSTFLEKKLAEKLPEPPPVPVIAAKKVESRGEVRQMVALAATCSGVHEQKEGQVGSQKFRVSYKDMEMQSVSVTIQRSPSLEDALLEYAKSKGEIDVAQCASELKVPFGDVVKALEKLGAEGKIEIVQ